MSETAVKSINDIARLAGVSKSTVSRALSDSPLISAKTRARIQAIAEANNFAIHQGARNLSMQRTNTIAVVIPIDPTVGRLVTDPFNLDLFGSIANVMAEHSYDLLVAQVKKDDRQPIDHYLASRRVDGLILFACDVLPEELSRLVKSRAPFIMWGPPAPHGEYCSVGSDDEQGGYLATRHLLDQGRRRIAFISGPFGSPESTLRYQGYERALHEAGLPIDMALLDVGDYTTQSGNEAMKAILERGKPVDAVFSSSDQMALGAVQAVQETGRRVPQDVAVVGYDGTPITAHANPPLTTVRQDIASAGRLLVENLLTYLDDGRPSSVVLPVELVVRQSTVE
ncbi:MAG: LacI family DNA-binding transcriptional regulator [Anaerolineae bacterium]